MSTAWQAAIGLLHFMQGTRLADQITFTTIISTCGRTSRWRKALSLYEELAESQVLSDLQCKEVMVVMSAMFCDCDACDVWNFFWFPVALQFEQPARAVGGDGGCEDNCWR